MEQENQRLIEAAPAEDAAARTPLLQEMTEESILEKPVLPPEEIPVTEIEPERQLEFEQESPSQTDITHRLAEEFFLLREEFPSLQSPEQLPDAVLDMAVEKSIPLLDAYLRFRHEEEKRVRREEERRRQAAGQSAGSLLQGTVETHPEQDAFMRAFRTALK